MITLEQAQALRQLYPQVVTINDGVATDANGNQVEFDQSAVDAKAEELKMAELTAWQDKDMAKQSALAKLSALGLTEDEVKAIVG
jgi:glycosylphosphatidylinositol transamidase (GPIT) subunit GPI8